MRDKHVHKKDFIHNKGFRCFYTNADSLLNKFEELKLEAKNNEPKIIAICETKPKNFRFNLSEAELQLEGYNLFHNSFEKNNERGIAVYVHKTIEATTLEVKSPARESIWLDIKLNNNDNLLVGCIYRSPSNTKDQDNDFIQMMREMTQLQYSHILTMGDFNLPKIDWHTWETPNKNMADTGNRLIEVLRDAFLHQHILTATRNRNKDNPSLLDLIITNEQNMISDLELTSPLGNSDHSCIHFWFNCYINYKKSDIQHYLYDKGDYEAMRTDISDIDWDQELDRRITVNEKWKFISNKLNEVTTKYIPKSKPHNKNKLKFATPLDKSSLAKIKKKHKAWKKYMNSRDSETYREYCKFRNQVRNITKQSRKFRERDVAKDAKENPKKFWKYVNSKTKTKPGIPNLQKSDKEDDLTKDDNEKAEVLLNYFSSVFTNEPCDEIPIPDIQDVPEPLDDINMTEDLIRKKLKALKTNKSPGPDKIHPRVLHELSDVLANPLYILFTASVLQETIPEDWRTASVSAIFKKGVKKMPNNYRPVSLTCICCKLLESIFRDVLIDHMKNNKLFSKSQFGFIGGRSTVLQLLTVLDRWTEILDQGGIIDVIYLDFMKAFDKVPHKRLIEKIKSYGIGQHITNWIQDFLHGRKHRVCVNGKFSSWAPVTSGIPQGSVLGPLLFVLYINDLPKDIISDIYLFADDTKIFTQVTNMEDAAKLQDDLTKLQEWSDRWLLKFHPGKCKVVDIGMRDRISYNYYLDNTELEHSEVEKDLGVHIDNRLKFDTHMGTKINKANNVLGAIRRSFSYLDNTVLLRLYTSLVRPHLEYANPVWNPRYKKDIRNIENVQKRATKMIPTLRDLPYKDRLKTLKLPTLAYRRLRGDMIEVYKLTRGKYDPEVSDLLCQHKKVIPHTADRTRGHCEKLYKRKHRLEVRKHNFTFRVVDPWNSLPEMVVTAPSLHSFERRLDKFWTNQDIKYDFKKCLKITHSNRAPDRDLEEMDVDDDEDLRMMGR